MGELVALFPMIIHAALGRALDVLLVTCSPVEWRGPFLSPSLFPWVASLCAPSAAYSDMRAEAERLLAVLPAVPPMAFVDPLQATLVRDAVAGSSESDDPTAPDADGAGNTATAAAAAASALAEAGSRSELTAWRALFLVLDGACVAENCALAPCTAAALAAHAPRASVTAALLVLRAGAALAPHRGVSRAIVRCHIALVVPQPNACELRVARDGEGGILHSPAPVSECNPRRTSATAGEDRERVGGDDDGWGETRRWREGEAIFFDDRRWHAAHNSGTADRVVLLIDIPRDACVGALPNSWLRRVCAWWRGMACTSGDARCCSVHRDEAFVARASKGAPALRRLMAAVAAARLDGECSDSSPRSNCSCEIAARKGEQGG